MEWGRRGSQHVPHGDVCSLGSPNPIRAAPALVDDRSPRNSHHLRFTSGTTTTAKRDVPDDSLWVRRVWKTLRYGTDCTGYDNTVSSGASRRRSCRLLCVYGEGGI